MMSECFSTVTPKLAAAPQAASEVDQTRPRGYCCMNLLPPVGKSIESLDVDTPDAVASGKETASGSSKVSSDICVTGIRDDSSFRKVDGKVCLEPG